MTPNTLKRLRKVYGLSQFTLAKASGVSRYKLSLYENGYTTLTKSTVALIERGIQNATSKKKQTRTTTTSTNLRG